MKKLFAYTLIMLSLTCCEKQIDWNFPRSNMDLIIVDGTITNEIKAQSIRLTFPVSQLNQAPNPVIGATVNISDEDSVYQLTEQPANSGIYMTDDNFAGQPGKHYTLLIHYKGKIYSAKTIMLQGNIFNLLQYAKSGKDDLYHITTVASAYNAQRFAMYEIFLDWSAVPGYENINPDSCKARLLYYTLPTVDVSQVFAPTLENVLFPYGTKITERRYSITAEHAEFIRALLSETNWNGGYFDSARSNLPTNISSGGAGFFAACGVMSIKDSVH